MDQDRLSSETTEYGRKNTKDKKSSESWLKSVSAFANGAGGVLVFGASPDGTAAGIKDVENASNSIRQKIKKSIIPFPDVSLKVQRAADGRETLLLEVSPGQDTPYYYIGGGAAEVYVRGGKESVPAKMEDLKRLVLAGRQVSFDARVTQYDAGDFDFLEFCDSYEEWTGDRMDDGKFEQYGLVKGGKLTNAGALFADHSPAGYSKIVCTRWKGIDKSGGRDLDADSREYTGSLITLVNKGIGFIKQNMKVLWKETGGIKTEMPDYCDRSVFEALVNALVHRDYTIGGSGIYIELFDDRLMISSPGGMADGTCIQEKEPGVTISVRRNPLLFDLFCRIGYAQKKGCGLEKIRKTYEKAENYIPEAAPEFYSDRGQFTVILKNLNYVRQDKKKDNRQTAVRDDKRDDRQTAVRDNKRDAGQVSGKDSGKDNKQVQTAVRDSKQSDSQNKKQDVEDSIRQSGAVLTDNEKKVLKVIAAQPTISTDQISRQTEIAKRTVERALQSLKKKEIVVREGSRRNGYWIVKAV